MRWSHVSVDGIVTDVAEITHHRYVEETSHSPTRSPTVLHLHVARTPYPEILKSHYQHRVVHQLVRIRRSRAGCEYSLGVQKESQEACKHSCGNCESTQQCDRSADANVLWTHNSPPSDFEGSLVGGQSCATLTLSQVYSLIFEGITGLGVEAVDSSVPETILEVASIAVEVIVGEVGLGGTIGEFLDRQRFGTNSGNPALGVDAIDCGIGIAISAAILVVNRIGIYGQIHRCSRNKRLGQSCLHFGNDDFNRLHLGKKVAAGQVLLDILFDSVGYELRIRSHLHCVSLVGVVFSDELEVILDNEFAVNGGGGQEFRLIELGDGVGESEGNQQQLKQKFSDIHRYIIKIQQRKCQKQLSILTFWRQNIRVQNQLSKKMRARIQKTYISTIVEKIFELRIQVYLIDE